MNQILFEEKNKNFRISHIAQKSARDMPRQHLHIGYEIYYLLQGKCYYFINDKTYDISSGSLVLIPSGTLHRTSVFTSSDYHERFLLIMNEEWINPFLHKIGLSSLDFYFNILPVIQLDALKQKKLLQLLDDIYSELSTKQSNYEISIKMKISELLILISRCTNSSMNSSTPFLSQTAKHKNVNKATFYIKSNFKNPISLQDVADYVYVSRGYLSNIFNEVTGTKITDYINLQRINYAKQLLTNSSDSITTIAGNSGFENITYFERIFNQITGMSPLKYRQSIKSSKKTNN